MQRATKFAKTSHGACNHGKGDKETTVPCIGCGDQLQPDHTGIVCMNDHHICTKGCASRFVEHVLGLGPGGIPVKCMQCHVDIVPNTFERNVPAEMQQIYTDTSVLVGGQLIPGERWHNCPFCNNKVILIESPGDLTFDCGGCNVTSCMICFSKLSSRRDVERHLLTCGLHGALKNEFVNIISRASQGICPGCGHMGQKDDACTHMTCPVCRTRWCYVCGLARNEADGGEFEHNSNWQSNPARCPMYLQSIRKRNPSWPRKPDECLAHFHRRRILFALRQKVEEVGAERVDQMLEVFPTALDGIPLEEILHADPPRDF